MSTSLPFSNLRVSPQGLLIWTSLSFPPVRWPQDNGAATGWLKSSTVSVPAASQKQQHLFWPNLRSHTSLAPYFIMAPSKPQDSKMGEEIPCFGGGASGF